LFRIDRTLVSYDLSEKEYTTISILSNSAGRYAEREKAGKKKEGAVARGNGGSAAGEDKSGGEKAEAYCKAPKKKAGEICAGRKRTPPASGRKRTRPAMGRQKGGR
jgi:hypothetical protein